MIAYRNGSARCGRSDVATVVDGQEDVHNLGLFNGQPAVIVPVTGQPGANVIATVDAVKAELPALAGGAAQADIKMSLAVDRTTSIRAALGGVEQTLLISVLQVIVVVVVFLRTGSTTLVPAVAVVISLLGTLGEMFLLGFSLDNLSLMALTVSTGFVVDDAIVVLENITRHVEQGMGRRSRPALLGAQARSASRVLSITVSLIAVFTPILFMGGDSRPAVPRVLDHPLRGHRDLADHLPDHHADALRLPRATAGPGRPAQLVRPGVPGRFRLDDQGL